jgi:hypothetical protein
VRLGQRQEVRGGEALGTFVAEIGLRRRQRGPVRRGLDPLSFDLDETAGFVQQRLDDLLGLAVATFAEVVVSNRPLSVCDVERGPVAVRKGVPDGVVAVDGDGIHDSPLIDGRADAVDVCLERELGRMDADDGEAVLAVLLVPRASVGSGADPVDAGERPEVDDDDVSAEVGRGHRLRVEPLGCAGERRQVALVGEADVFERGHGSRLRPSRR